MAIAHRKGEAIRRGCRPLRAKAATTPQLKLATTTAAIMHLPAGTMATTRPRGMAASMIPLPNCRAIGISTKTMNLLVVEFYG